MLLHRQRVKRTSAPAHQITSFVSRFSFSLPLFFSTQLPCLFVNESANAQKIHHTLNKCKPKSSKTQKKNAKTQKPKTAERRSGNFQRKFECHFRSVVCSIIFYPSFLHAHAFRPSIVSYVVCVCVCMSVRFCLMPIPEPIPNKHHQPSRRAHRDSLRTVGGPGRRPLFLVMHKLNCVSLCVCVCKGGSDFFASQPKTERPWAEGPTPNVTFPNGSHLQTDRSFDPGGKRHNAKWWPARNRYYLFPYTRQGRNHPAFDTFVS